jgi:hypothetical protein
MKLQHIRVFIKPNTAKLWLQDMPKSGVFYSHKRETAGKAKWMHCII